MLCLVQTSVQLPSAILVHSTTVIQNVNKAQVKVRAKKDNVAGQHQNHFHRHCKQDKFSFIRLYLLLFFSQVSPFQFLNITKKAETVSPVSFLGLA